MVGLRSEQQGELGIFVQEVQRGGLAFVDGRLKEGDQVYGLDCRQTYVSIVSCLNPFDCTLFDNPSLLSDALLYNECIRN